MLILLYIVCEQVSQLCHTVSYSLRMPSWLPLDEWFMPLAWHIEHHMAPKLPDENLHKVAGDVQALAAKHRLPYQVVPFERALWEFSRSCEALQSATVRYDALSGLIALDRS